MALRSSGTCCAVRGCTNNQTKLNLWLDEQCFEHAPLKKRSCPCDCWYSFYRLPKEEEARTAWLKNLKIKKPPKAFYVCSFHFVDKWPTEENPHPTLWLGSETPPKKRRRVITGSGSGADGGSPDDMEMKDQPCSTSTRSRDAQTQWSNPEMEDHTYSKEAVITLSMTSHPVAYSILESDADSLLYTGIGLVELHTLVSCLKPHAPTTSSAPVVDQILMTLMKLRQNFVMADLARRFKTPVNEVSKTVAQWVDIMSEYMQDLVLWLPHDTIKATLPPAFMEHFSDTTCVVDCGRTTMQNGKKMDSTSESHSHFYANKTVKYLVATSPSGIIMFISDAYGSKCSERDMVQNSGFLDYLCVGDEVMGYSGFTVKDLLEERRVNLIVPAARARRGSQLSNEEVTLRRRIANARVHVERALGRLKTFRILSHSVPRNMAAHTDKILRICAGLVNLRGKLVLSED